MKKTKNGAKSTDLLKKFFAEINRFARESGFVQRQSKKFKASVFLLALAQCSEQGDCGLNTLAMKMHSIDSSCKLSYQALHERIMREEVSLEVFLGKCLAFFVSDSVRRSLDTELAEGPFRRVLIQDSSFVKLLKRCSKLFPAHGNGKGETAGFKLDLVFDLLTGETVEAAVYGGTQQDRVSGGAILEHVGENDLVLRDMGYFSVAAFKEIEDAGGHWLSRLPNSTDGRCERGGKCLDELLDKTKGKLVDRRVLLTAKNKPARLVAIRRPKEEADKAVMALKKEAASKGRAPSRKSLIRARWYLLVTDLPAELVPAKVLAKIYALRWSIETTFKGWKQGSVFRKALKTNSSYQHLMGLILISAVRLVITQTVYARLLMSGHPEIHRLSFCKLSKWVGIQLTASDGFDELMKTQPDLRHVLSEKRARKTLREELLEVIA